VKLKKISRKTTKRFGEKIVRGTKIKNDKTRLKVRKIEGKCT
jgi:hypothetical protein